MLKILSPCPHEHCVCLRLILFNCRALKVSSSPCLIWLNLSKQSLPSALVICAPCWSVTFQDRCFCLLNPSDFKKVVFCCFETLNLAHWYVFYPLFHLFCWCCLFCEISKTEVIPAFSSYQLNLLLQLQKLLDFWTQLLTFLAILQFKCSEVFWTLLLKYAEDLLIHNLLAVLEPRVWEKSHSLKRRWLGMVILESRILFPLKQRQFILATFSLDPDLKA